MANKKRLILDFDGTLVEFKRVENLDELMKPGYFSSLFVFESIIKAIYQLHEDYPKIEILLASKVLDSPHIAKDKDIIIDKYLSFIPSENRIYIPYNCNKTDYIQVTPNDYLLDDYTKNLIEFEEAGGNGIKLLNGINANKKTWKGPEIHKDQPWVLIVDELKRYMKIGEEK